MHRSMHGLLATILSAPAWAAEEPSNITSTSLELYGVVVIAFIAGLLWVLWYKKKEEEREKRRKVRSSHSA